MLGNWRATRTASAKVSQAKKPLIQRTRPMRHHTGKQSELEIVIMRVAQLNCAVGSDLVDAPN
jgi:hypothetical protein